MTGRTLLDLARHANKSVTMIAPFVKVAVLSRLLTAVNPTIPVRLFTRWRLDEIAKGFNDPEAWKVIDSRGGAVYLCHHLHAKCYIFDDIASVGSANLTGRALAWHQNPNLELQLSVSADNAAVSDLVQILEEVAIPADRRMYEDVQRLADQLRTLVPTQSIAIENVKSPAPTAWLPQTRQPSQLFDVYRGATDRVTRAAADTASADLGYLGIPTGLPRASFDAAVRTVLAQLPFFRAVDRLSETPRRFGEYRATTRKYLSDHDLNRNAADAWQTCLRWLMHFCADRYDIVVPRYTELLKRRDRAEPEE